MGDRKKDKKDKKAPPVSRGKVLGAGDTFYFGPKGAWEGPTPSGGCMVYKVIGENGIFYVNHPNGKQQRHPPQKKTYYKTGNKVYICGTVAHLPEDPD